VRTFVFLAFVLVPTGTLALPETLEETGFSDGSATAFTPQYPLWSDGSAKRRWLRLPPGTSIDKSSPDAWEFPRGTKAWKEFSRGGRRIETRYIERLADGSWRFAAYQWNEEGTRAVLAPEEGVRAASIPSRADCLACHEGAPVPILGHSAVQLEAKLAEPALGYLHANCGHCHNDSGPLAEVGLSLAQRAGAPRESAARSARTAAVRRDDLVRRIRSTNPYVRMPPLGVNVVDADGVALVEQWLSRLRQKELQQ
jgi:Planctomycete cytochrome C